MTLPPQIDRTHHLDGVLARYEPAQPGLILPLILDSPHSGHAYPADFHHAPPRALLRRAEDAFVDDLFESAPRHGAVFLKALFPRSYIDPNRHEDEIDLTIMEEDWPNPVIASEKAEMGLGLIRRLIKGNVEIYDRPLSVAEVKGRIDRFHRPYLTELEHLADRAHAEFGIVWHLNCHSMRAQGRRRGQKIPRADFVLGDRDGTSCRPDFTATVRWILEDLGYLVAVNDPFKGAELVSRIGRPRDGRHSLQIEVNRGLYMDEDLIEKSADFDRFKRDIDRLIAGIADFVSAQMKTST
jgi:N-formylglutamate amidohydrolase